MSKCMTSSDRMLHNITVEIPAITVEEFRAAMMTELVKARDRGHMDPHVDLERLVCELEVELRV